MSAFAIGEAIGSVSKAKALVGRDIAVMEGEGRLALRVEGDWWKAYRAPHQSTMTGAVLIAQMRVSLAESAAEAAIRRAE